MIEKLFKTEEWVDDDGKNPITKLRLSDYGKERIGKFLRSLPPKTDLSQITRVSISNQAYYNYVNYDKPLSKKGVEACEALDKYISNEDEIRKENLAISLETAIKVVKHHGGKVTF